jgi:transcriptional regulator
VYIPKHNHETDAVVLAEFIAAHAFGVLISTADGRPVASHVPFLYERDATLPHCHVARATPPGRAFERAPEVLVIFAGPHGYVSPTWYADPGVPTWDYTAVHAYGTARAVDDPALTRAHVEELTAHYERGNSPPWTPTYDARRLTGIVAIEIRIRELEGKFKLSQNRSAADRAGVVANLTASGTDNDRELARLVAAAGPTQP